MNSNASCINCEHKKLSYIYGFIECQLNGSTRMYNSICEKYKGCGFVPKKNNPVVVMEDTKETANSDIDTQNEPLVEVTDQLPN